VKTAEMIGWVVKQALLIIGVIIVAAIAPVILTVLVIQNPQGGFDFFDQIFILLLTPLSVGLWMAFLCHWHSIRQWQRMGKPTGTFGSEWREAHGGRIHTSLKSVGFGLFGIFGSFVCEILYMLAFRYGVFNSLLLFPFAAYTPVLVLLYKRRNYSEEMPSTPRSSVAAEEDENEKQARCYIAVPDAIEAEDIDLARSLVKQLIGTSWEVGQDDLERWERAGHNMHGIKLVMLLRATGTQSPSSDDQTGGFEDDCSLLGVDEYYTLDELNAARRTKAAQWHPDKLNGMAPELKEFASEQLTRLNLAHERLANRVKSNACSDHSSARSRS